MARRRRKNQQRDLDERFIASQLTPFRNAMQGGRGKVTDWNGKKFNAKAYARCSTQGAFDRKDTSPVGKPKIALIIDCSGSMGGEPIDGAAHLAAILSDLHATNALEARIFCTGNSGGKSGTGGGFRVPLPQPHKVWEHLMAPHGQEYISQTFRQFQRELLECDLLACYTDADICDRLLEPSLWRKRGKTCVGLYQGDISQVDVMLRYFDYALARESKENLFVEYLRLVTRLLDR